VNWIAICRWWTSFTMEQQISTTLRRERLFAWLCGSFGVLALLLCMIGLYGVMSYATVRRSQEIGIRMALGASRNDVLRQVLGEGMGVAVIGLLIGAPASYWAAHRYVDYKKLGLDPLDPTMIAWPSRRWVCPRWPPFSLPPCARGVRSRQGSAAELT
jgi:predicted lysophospholipase L1 biosynthesis ABC-type transport system permease subunit